MKKAELKKGMSRCPSPKVTLLPVLGMSVLMSACGTVTSSSSGGTVLFGVQGTRPDSLSALSARSFRALSELSGVNSSVLDVASTSVDIDVLGTGGAVIGVLTLTDARVALEQIKFKTLEEREAEDGVTYGSEDRVALTSDGEDSEEGTDTEDSSSSEFEFEGPYVVDLITNTSTPSFSTISLPAGDYSEIQLKLHKIDGSEDDDEGAQAVDSSDPLFDNSVVLRGTYTPTSGSVQNFTFIYDLDEEFELSGSSNSVGFSLADGVDNSVLVAFRMAKWLDFTGQSADLSSLSGDILLDSTSSGGASSIREIVRDNVKASADYGKDEDGDGQLGAGEDDDDDSSGDDAEDEQSIQGKDLRTGPQAHRMSLGVFLWVIEGGQEGSERFHMRVTRIQEAIAILSDPMKIILSA